MKSNQSAQPKQLNEPVVEETSPISSTVSVDRLTSELKQLATNLLPFVSTKKQSQTTLPNEAAHRTESTTEEQLLDIMALTEDFLQALLQEVLFTICSGQRERVVFMHRAQVLFDLLPDTDDLDFSVETFFRALPLCVLLPLVNYVLKRFNYQLPGGRLDQSTISSVYFTASTLTEPMPVSIYFCRGFRFLAPYHGLLQRLLDIYINVEEHRRLKSLLDQVDEAELLSFIIDREEEEEEEGVGSEESPVKQEPTPSNASQNGNNSSRSKKAKKRKQNKGKNGKRKW